MKIMTSRDVELIVSFAMALFAVSMEGCGIHQVGTYIVMRMPSSMSKT